MPQRNENEIFLQEFLEENRTNVRKLNEGFMELKLSVVRLEDKQEVISNHMNDVLDMLKKLMNEHNKNINDISILQEDMGDLKNKKSFINRVGKIANHYRVLISFIFAISVFCFPLFYEIFIRHLKDVIR